MNSRIMLLLLLAPLLNCSNGDESQKKEGIQEKAITVYPKDSMSWYFIIFATDSTNGEDSFVLDKDNNFVFLDLSTNYDTVRVLDSFQNDISKKMRFTSLREVDKFKAFQFYFPSERQITQIAADKGLEFKIEKEGLTLLDSILQRN